MILRVAVATYVEGRSHRGEIAARSAEQLRSRLAGLVAACRSDLPIARLRRKHILRWQATIGHLRPATRRAYLSSVRVFCDWAVAEGLLAANPAAGLARITEPRPRPRALPAASIARLRLVLPDRRAELIVALMFRAGLRCVEVARLGPADYDPAAGTICVRGKGDDHRCLPLPPEVCRLMDHGSVIGLSSPWISRLVSRWMAAAGLKRGPYDGVSAHALRHSFASNTLERCRNVRTVQGALGHVSLATTQRYLRDVTLDELRAAMGV
jgi:integrase/recombinase XerC